MKELLRECLEKDLVLRQKAINALYGKKLYGEDVESYRGVMEEVSKGYEELAIKVNCRGLVVEKMQIRMQNPFVLGWSECFTREQLERTTRRLNESDLHTVTQHSLNIWGSEFSDSSVCAKFLSRLPKEKIPMETFKEIVASAWIVAKDIKANLSFRGFRDSNKSKIKMDDVEFMLGFKEELDIIKKELNVPMEYVDFQIQFDSEGIDFYRNRIEKYIEEVERIAERVKGVEPQRLFNQIRLANCIAQLNMDIAGIVSEFN